MQGNPFYLRIPALGQASEWLTVIVLSDKALRTVSSTFPVTSGRLAAPSCQKDKGVEECHAHAAGRFPGN